MSQPHGTCPACGAPTQQLVIPVLPTLHDLEPDPITTVVCTSLLCATNLAVDIPA